MTELLLRMCVFYRAAIIVTWLHTRGVGAFCSLLSLLESHISHLKDHTMPYMVVLQVCFYILHVSTLKGKGLCLCSGWLPQPTF